MSGHAGWALVTGASSGIGEAFARELARRNRRVIVVARRRDRLEKLAAELGGADKVAVVAGDLAQPDGAQRVFEETRQRALEVDLLVNNAGLGVTGPFAKEPLERIQGVLDLNVRAVTQMTRLFLEPMVQRGRGAIVNVVSTSAFQPVPFLATYAATKSYVLSLTEALEFELAGSGVKVQALCPGLTATEFQQVAGTDQVAFNKTAALKPSDVAAYSLDKLEGGSGRVIPGWQNRVVANVQSLIPRAVVRRVAGELFRPTDPQPP